MATQLQLRRGTAAENAVFTGAEGELTMSTDTKTLQIHDGSTTGGFMVDPVVAFQKPTAGNGYTWFRKYASGWVEQGGIKTGTPASITFSVEMADTNYFASATPIGSGGSSNYSPAAERQTTGMTVRFYTESRDICWEVRGMAA